MLLLTSRTFSSTGGIQRLTKSLAHAMRSISQESPRQRFTMYALHDRNSDERYIDEKQFRGFAGKRCLFLASSVIMGVKSKTVLLNHINLLPIGICIKIVSRRPKVIILAHGVEVWKEMAKWKKLFLNHHAFIWAVSDFTANQLAVKNGIRSSRITTLNPGIDPLFKVPTGFLKSQHLLKKYCIAKDQQILVSISRVTKFDSEKGYEKLLMVLPELLFEFPKIVYLLCGPSDKEERARLNLIIRKKRLQKHVRLINFIPDNQLVDHYQLADLFVLPSKKEGFGLVFIEAAACGCRIISGNSDGSIDALRNGKLGTMVDPDNLQDLKHAIIKQLRSKRSHEEAKHIQRACLESFHCNIFKNKVNSLIIHHER